MIGARRIHLRARVYKRPGALEIPRVLKLVLPPPGVDFAVLFFNPLVDLDIGYEPQAFSLLRDLP